MLNLICIIINFTNVDLLSIQATPTNRTIGERGMATFTATASGVNIDNFIYQWKKRDSDSLPDKVSGVDGITLVIPNLIISDGGQYYCIVTNQWGRSVESNDVILTVEGTYCTINNQKRKQHITISEELCFA